MARTPEPPELTINKSFLRYALEVFLKGVIVIWLYIQAIGFVFYMLWHNGGVPLREFMFRDAINYWNKWGDYIQWELTPKWLQWIWFIPSWQNIWPWVVIVTLLALYIWGYRGFPSLNFKVPRTYHMKPDNPYNPNYNQDGTSAGDDDFNFDPSAFSGDGQQKGADTDVKQIDHLPYSERERRLKAMADHPNTPKHEREIAKRKLREMGR